MRKDHVIEALVSSLLIILGTILIFKVDLQGTNYILGPLLLVVGIYGIWTLAQEFIK